MVLPNFTNCLRTRFCCCLKNAKRVITISWFISLAQVIGAFISACVAANKLTHAGASATPAAFAAMWTGLVLIVISIMGTVIMRRSQAAVSIGFLLGVVFVMANQMLILFAIFTERANRVGLADGAAQLQAQHSMAVFSFFLFVTYSFFGSVLAIFRYEIVKADDQSGGNSSDAVQYSDYKENETAQEA